MPAEAHGNAVAFLERLALVGLEIAVRILQQPHVRDAREIHFPVQRHDPGAGAIEGIVEAFRVELGVVAFPVPVPILDHADLFRMLSVVGERLLIRVFLVHLQSLGGGGELVIVRHPWVATVVLDATPESVCLRDVQAILFIEGDRSRCLHVGLACEKFRHHSLGSLDRCEDGFFLLQRWDGNRVRRALGFLIGERGGNERGGEQRGECEREMAFHGELRRKGRASSR